MASCRISAQQHAQAWCMRRARVAGSAGFTLLELAVTVVVVAILTTFLLNRIMFYRDQAEEVAMQQVVGNLRSALHLQLALLLARNRDQELLQLAQQNPMDWLAEKPANYLGEIESADATDLVLGNWYFVKRDKRLLYLFANRPAPSKQASAETASTGKNEGNRVYLNVKLVRATPARQTNLAYAGMQKNAIEGIVLEQIGP